MAAFWGFRTFEAGGGEYVVCPSGPIHSQVAIMSGLQHAMSNAASAAVPGAPSKKRQGVVRYSQSGLVVVSVGVASLASFLGSAYGQNVLKAAAILFMLLAAYCTGRLLRRYGHAIHTGPALFLLFLCSVLPVVRIAIEVLPTFSRQDIVDGLAIIAPYYLLPFPALALVACLAATATDFKKIFGRPLLITLGFVLGLVSLGYYSISPTEVAGIYTIYNNFFIPLALYLFFQGSWQKKLVGILVLAFIFILAGLQGSRSYLLVAGYLSLFAILFGGRNKGVKYVALTVSVGFLILAIPFLANLSLGTADALTVLTKLQLDTLLPTIRVFLESGDFRALYFWEGNSRAGILINAFGDFDWWDYIWGRGTSATYVSFVTRTTIEIGYAQELFWLGAVTFVPVLWLTARALARIVSFPAWRRSDLGKLFIAIAIVRVLDGLIYGMPTSSIYMLIYWMAVMWLGLKPAYRKALFTNAPPQIKRQVWHCRVHPQAAPNTLPIME